MCSTALFSRYYSIAFEREVTMQTFFFRQIYFDTILTRYKYFTQSVVYLQRHASNIHTTAQLYQQNRLAQNLKYIMPILTIRHFTY